MATNNPITHSNTNLLMCTTSHVSQQAMSRITLPQVTSTCVSRKSGLGEL
eukprot:m.287024 g.287024  ORF g.287024 m.287024 type:complete len:50 (-) comp15786_c2_seq1:2632-2781(-)